MSCPYFDEGYIGTCKASGSTCIPTIAMMETFCFRDTYGRCPYLSDSLILSHQGVA